MTITRSVLITLLGSLLLLPGCGREEPAPTADPTTRAWVAAYGEQLDRWAEGAAQVGAAIQQRAWRRLGRVVRRMGRDGDSVRKRFAEVPPALAGAEDLYTLLLAAGDAASTWADVYRRDPPPYLGNADGQAKSQALADAAADFQAKVNRAADALQ
jgi:hypothetical protein